MIAIPFAILHWPMYLPLRRTGRRGQTCGGTLLRMASRGLRPHTDLTQAKAGTPGLR